MEEKIIIIEDDTDQELVIVENDVEYIPPVTQEKTITASLDIQVVTPDKDYTGLSKVTVNGFPINLGTKTITTNGIYKAINDNLDGYSEVEVETSGVDINDYFVTTMTNSNSRSFTSNFIKKCPKLTISSDVVNLNYAFSDFKPSMQDWNSFIQGDTSNVQTMQNCFASIQENTHGIKYIAPNLNTKNVTDMSYLFSASYDFVTIPEYNAENVVNVLNAFLNMLNLVTFGGLKDLGKNFDTTKSDNWFYYNFNLSSSSKLTYESLMNVINNLYDIKSKGCNTQQLMLGSTNLAKLTAEEIAIATEKGWSVS